jgi:hypothetical protein
MNFETPVSADAQNWLIGTVSPIFMSAVDLMLAMK